MGADIATALLSQTLALGGGGGGEGVDTAAPLEVGTPNSPTSKLQSHLDEHL